MGRIYRGIIKLVEATTPFRHKNKSGKIKYQGFQNLSFAQEGEDMILNRFFEEQANGFYVDVGAHHPIRFSNTYRFYLRGWTGINIDAMPGSMDAFNKIRPNDINLELGISETPEDLTYYIFNEPALNTFSKEEAEMKDGIRTFKIIETRTTRAHTLAEVLDRYMPQDIKIDIMSIDVEGLDLAVLKSNNWKKYRPSMLLVESLREDMDSIKTNDIYVFLSNLGYKLVAKTYNTMFFKDADS